MHVNYVCSMNMYRVQALACGCILNKEKGIVSVSTNHCMAIQDFVRELV